MRIALISFAVGWMLVGCAWLEPVGVALPDPTSGEARAVGIYSAVIRTLATKDHTFGGRDPGFTRIYVLDGVVRKAPGPLSEGGGPRVPFSPVVQDELAESLEDLPPLTFVRTRDEAVGNREPERVRGGGVLLTLGPAVGDGDRVEIDTELWIGNLGARWVTYVVELRDGAWRVVGTTGPIAVA